MWVTKLTYFQDNLERLGWSARHGDLGITRGLKTQLILSYHNLLVGIQNTKYILNSSLSFTLNYQP